MRGCCIYQLTSITIHPVTQLGIVQLFPLSSFLLFLCLPILPRNGCIERVFFFSTGGRHGWLKALERSLTVLDGQEPSAHFVPSIDWGYCLFQSRFTLRSQFTTSVLTAHGTAPSTSYRIWSWHRGRWSSVLYYLRLRFAALKWLVERFLEMRYTWTLLGNSE